MDVSRTMIRKCDGAKIQAQFLVPIIVVRFLARVVSNGVFRSCDGASQLLVTFLSDSFTLLQSVYPLNAAVIFRHAS